MIASAPPPVHDASSPDTWTMNRPRPPPKRYPAIGFGLLAIFVFGSYAVFLGHFGVAALRAMGSSRSQGAAQENVAAAPFDALPADTSIEAALVRAAKSLRGVVCMENSAFPLDPECRKQATAAIEEFSHVMKTEIIPFRGKVSGPARRLRPLAIQVNVMVLSVLPKVRLTRAADDATRLEVNVFAQSAVDFGEQVNTAYDLSNPKWGPPAAAGSSGSAAARMDQATGSSQHTAGADATPIGAPAPAIPVLPKKDPALVRSLVEEVRTVQQDLANAGHSPDRIIQAVTRAHAALDRVGEDLQRYRAMPHGDEDAQGRAQAFVTRIDETRGHLMRACIELQRAMLVTSTDLDEPPFRKSDDLLSTAADDVKLAEILAKTAP